MFVLEIYISLLFIPCTSKQIISFDSFYLIDHGE